MKACIFENLFLSYFLSDDFGAPRESRICEYRCEIDQSEHGLSFTAV